MSENDTRVKTIQAIAEPAAALESGGSSGAPVVRRNIATLSQGEWIRLRDAIVAADREFFYRDLNYTDRVSLWDKQDEIHQATHVHNGPAFLPWHRELVNRFEALLRQIDPGVTLHYWDWTTDPRHSPAGQGRNVNLFTTGVDGFMGNAQGRADVPLDTLDNGGTLAGSRDDTHEPADPPREITRQVGSGAPDVPSDTDAIDGADFATMRLNLEDAHNAAHGYIGGTLGTAHSSFEDPFVFLLHSNLDRLFASWQLRRIGDKRYVSPRLDPGTVYGTETNDQSIVAAMEPWAGGTGTKPWSEPGLATLKHCRDRTVVDPPLYDKYAYDVTFSWAALFLSLPLEDGDVIYARIDDGVVDPAAVEFVLETVTPVDWWKAIRVPDGLGNSWLIETDGNKRSDRVTLWAEQVHNGQQLIFHKAKQWGAKRIVYRLGDLDRLPPGSRVTFRWLKD
jgi:hypothetical protein